MGRKFEVRKAAMAKTGLAKTKLYSRFGKEIYMSAKNGGPNPDANLSLKHLIEKAKKAQVPGDVIKRNIDKAAAGKGEDFQAIRYEGFGPGGIGIIVDTLTDNVNRTVSEVRNCFTKVGKSMGVSGSVEHSYSHLSYVSVKGLTDEEALETLLMADIEVNEIEDNEGVIEIEGNGYDGDKIVDALTADFPEIEVVENESGWYPLEYIELDEEDTKLFEKFENLINEVEDVQNFYHNVKQD
ncbi:YebC/PmpR family DNA-binding transcriptional regulator [Candidatus Izimaplasma bacterium ZiA1]|uniref:YebC/PmpR family DNA-binding transcriptional regulator n=1 Tax=Candidatus Izimoplasma sp. ZiA1 TaxID=2024899 RepID=UPI000BAA6F3D|nr:YebC/PmpR family DNA-binding transcriptional regulator [Candidatus Izimaplasma bacterium ZiA1]